MKLVIGAGDRRLEGFKHHDVQALEGLDYVCEFYDLPNNVKEPVEEIHFTHVLEHFPMNESIKVLRTIYSLLASQGKLYLEVPNLYWNAEEIVRNPRARQNVEYIFGGQRNKWDFHYNGYTPELLADDLREAGFDVLELKPFSSIECWAEKNG